MENYQSTTKILINKANLFFFNIFLLLLFATNTNGQDAINYVDYVNPLVGTDSSFELSNGNTYPAIAIPWGMNFWTPQTGEMGDGWIYTYKNQGLVGIRQTHQPSPWINDYGAFSLMPVVGELKLLENEDELLLKILM